MDHRGQETLGKLRLAFGRPGTVFFSKPKVVPVGIEVEVPWRNYFPDLWVNGFPNISDAEMSEITEECNRRESILLPQLRKTVDCGVNKGNDRYWEFAFNPVSSVGIIVNQLSVIREAGLMPGRMNSLHVTFGGVRVCRYSYYIALVAEAMVTSQERIRSAFTQGTTSRGWARKGYAGVYEKQGSYDMMYGFQYGTELRLAEVPDNTIDLYNMLHVTQQMAVEVYQIQSGVFSSKTVFDNMISELASILVRAGLPDKNWKKPHMEPETWEWFAEVLPEIRPQVIRVLEKYEYL